VAQAIDSTGGLTFLLAALKVLSSTASNRTSSLTTIQMRSLKDGAHIEWLDPAGVEDLFDRLYGVLI